ncbi:MAG: hypothetical protein IPG90_13940 [Bacteroidetes bacterium]|nr:hypothetical protein [Bacteroidota bacterium]
MMKFELPIVVVNAGELYATSVDTGRLQFYGDEPVEKGGADVGPTAHQLFLHHLEPVPPSLCGCMQTERNGICKK